MVVKRIPIEQRKELIKELLLVRHTFSQEKLGKELGVSQQQIGKDKAAVMKSIQKQLEGKMEVRVFAQYERTMACLEAQGEYYQAWKVTMELYEWLFKTGKESKVAEKLDISHTETEKKLKEAYTNLLSQGEPIEKTKKRMK